MNRAMLQLLLGASLVSFTSVMVKLTHTGPVATAFHRVLLGGIFLASLALLKGDRLWVGWKAFLAAAAAGVFWALDLAVWHHSILSIGPGAATLMLSLQVFFLAGTGVLFMGEKLKPSLIASVFMALGGLYLIVSPHWQIEGSGYRWGVILALTAAFFYSLYLLTLRFSVNRTPRLSPLANMAVISLCCAMVLGPSSWLSGESLAAPEALDWLWLIINGLICHSLGWMLISRGITGTPASITGLALMIQPALAFFWDVLIFSRPTSLIQAGGVLLVLSGIYLGASRNNK